MRTTGNKHVGYGLDTIPSKAHHKFCDIENNMQNLTCNYIAPLGVTMNYNELLLSPGLDIQETTWHWNQIEMDSEWLWSELEM